MSQFLPRAASSLRAVVSRPVHAPSGLLSRQLPLPIIQSCRLSGLKGDAPRKRHGRNSIPPQEKRPISKPPVPPPTKTPEELAQLPYLVARTPSLQLPVYRKWSSGGMKQTVLIRKIYGDKRKMIEDLTEAFKLTKEDVRLNPTTQHIELKGDRFATTKTWLLEKGF